MALQTGGTNVEYLQNSAQIKYYLGDVQGAINDYNGAIAKCQTNSELYAQRAFYKFEKKNYESAKEDYSKAISLNPKKAHFYFMRASVEKILNQEIDAENDFRQSKNLGLE
jgi:tetratricopeptide (TPR) repeat protein